jgi:UDP-2,3-diacylglucosamine pyrophosphatase LpxH
MHGVRGVSRYRTIWISDIHLGSRGCKAEFLLDFLKYTEAETIFLVGDIVDGWRLKRSWYWPQAHNDVVQKLLRKARKGTKVIYIPGNHDEMLKDYTEMQFGGVDVVPEFVHETADGKKFLITHGDDFDAVVRHAKWIALLGDWAYNALIELNNHFNWVRRKLGLSYWSLSAYIKHKVKNAVEYISRFEVAVADEVRRRGLDGAICGHIHHAEIRDIDGIIYCNDGDWVESCTALVEHSNGRLKLLRWTEIQPMPLFVRPAPPKAHQPEPVSA